MIHRDPRLLVVDDLQLTRIMMCKALRELGYQSVEEALDGEQAWQQLIAEAQASAPYTLVLAGRNVPQKDGLQLWKECRNETLLQSTPFVLINDDQDERSVIVDDPLLEHLKKPFRPGEIKTRIDAINGVLEYHQAS